MNVVLRNVDKNLETWALLFFYSLLVTTMAVEVVRRELFSFSSIWGEEIVRYAFIYLVWIGAAAGIRDRAHIRIDVAFTYVGERTKAIFYLFGDFVMLGLSVVALWYSLFSKPVKTFLNWTIPELANINVGSLLGTKLLDSTIL